jgi:DNA invertase Pin-like site-specific DNA recombinase
LSAAGADQVFRETASGARADREQLRRALGQLAKGDVLMVTQLDRLARSTRDLAKSCGVSVSTISRLNPSLLSA